MAFELGDCYIIRVYRVDPNLVKMGNHHVETAWVQGNCLDRIMQLLHNLELETARMRRVVPHHEGLVTCGSHEQGLLHAR